MKKLIIISTSILLSIYVILSLLSLGDGYHAERSLWRINRSLTFMASHIESTPDIQIKELADKYRRFIAQYNKTIYAKRAQLMLGDVYSLKKDYAQARIEYQKAVCSDKELSAQAEVTIAKSYEMEGDWEKALSAYQSAARNYPLTNSGFYIPIYLARHAGTSEDQDTYADALAFYQKIASEHPKSIFENSALKMIALCQVNQKNWAGAVKTMGELILKYPSGKSLQEAVNGINLLCVTKIHNYDLAINIYTAFLQKYPNHPADPILKKMIKDLQMLKNKKLIINSSSRNASSQ